MSRRVGQGGRLAALALAAASGLGLGGCSPAARSRAEFTAHPAAARAAIAGCQTGEIRGPECDNAEAGVAAAARDARMAAWRKRF